MKSKSFTHARRLTCHERSRMASHPHRRNPFIRYLKASRSRSERRRVRQILHGAVCVSRVNEVVGCAQAIEYIPPVVKTRNHTGSAAWVLA